MSKKKQTVRDKPVDICFVLDATRSTQSVFTSMVNQVNDLAFDLRTNNRRAAFQYGAIIYRDPVDYKEPPPSAPLPKDMQDEINAFEAKQKEERINRLKAADLYDEELEAEKEENAKHIDREKYPVSENVAIPFKDNIEHLIQELMKVECDGGNDDPEDWVGALSLALDGLKWRDKSKKCIVWIADANAHGRRYCGYDNHNEEEPKLEPLVERMADERVYFVGINVKKGEDEGCQQTLQEMRTIYQNAGGVSFITADFVPEYNEDLYGEDDWPADVLNNFMQTIAKTIAKMPMDLD